MIKIIDYGSGNVKAIANIYKSLGINYECIKNPSGLAGASKLILPGVGAFDETMSLLETSGFIDELNKLVLIEEIPILGICVGMQIMAKSSDEGEKKGLCWLDAKVKRFKEAMIADKPYLPHMGWNQVQPVNDNPLLDGIDNEIGFYFLHSYYIKCNNEEVMSKTYYGIDFTSSVNRNNIYGVQFHPEKSHSNGVLIFQNFAKIKS